MKKKTSIVSLVVLLAFSMVLSACSGKNGNNPESSPKSSNAVSPEQGASEPGKSDKKIAITVYNAATFNQAAPIPSKEDDIIRQMFEKELNIDFKMTVPPQGQDVTKLNLLISSNDAPDLMNFRLLTRAYSFYDQGILADLDEVIDRYPALKERFTEEQWSSMKYNGKTIGIPVSDPTSGTMSWWIRYDWLKKLNLSVPTTPDELLEVLKAFTFDDPDGNSKDDTYGITGGVLKDGNTILGLDGLYAMFGTFPNQIDVKDGKVVIYNTDNRTKEALAYLNKLYSAKVIDPDFATITDKVGMDQKFLKGKSGFAITDWRSLEPNSQQQMKDLGGETPEWIAIPPMKGPFGDQISSVAGSQNNMWAISKKAAEDPEKLDRIMQLLQYWYTDEESYPYIAYGVKGETWDIVDGKPKKLELTKEIEDKYKYIAHYQLSRRGDDPIYFNYENPKTDEYRQLNLKYVYSNPYNQRVTADPEDKSIADRQKYTSEMFLRFVTGKEPISNWDAYLQTLESKFNQKKYEENVIKQLSDLGLLQ